jgi:AIPR protein
MRSNVGMSVDVFRQNLRNEVEEICKDTGKSYDKEADRGYAFELWVAGFLIRENDLEIEPESCAFQSNDLKIDIAFDDEESKIIVLAQTKFASLNQNPALSEDEVAAFFDRHDIFLNKQSWVRQHSSDELHDLISDYPDRITNDWTATYLFVSTGKASDRVKNLVAAKQKYVKVTFPNVNFILWDFYDLKEEYIRAQSIEAAISESVDIQFPEESIVIKNEPHQTILSVVKGTTLAALYRKERERLFAYNIRTFLGKRVNKTIIDTAINHPEDFYYFNNGVSAICTRINDLGNRRFRFDNFQIINGAQTVGSLAQISSLSPKCEVILRVTQGASVKTEKGFNADIILYNNTQNVVRASDFRSNDGIQLWLEDKFAKTKARGGLTEPIRYVRKRSYKRVRGGVALKFEDLAKIRFAYFYEPTQCVADPRSLWTPKEDGGVYEKAFGIDGELKAHWSDAEFAETVFAVVAFNAIVERISAQIRADKPKFFFLKRMRYWALALVPIQIEKRGHSIEELLSSKQKFENWFAGFWRDIVRDLIHAFQSAQEAKISNFALARNENPGPLQRAE